MNVTLLNTVLAFVAALGVLVTIHEFGHYWVARRCGVKILRFSVGFGRPLWLRRFGADRTEFAIAAVPLGGYVRMLDEREGPVSQAERGRAFNNQPLAARTAIVAAGPLFNFAFAVLAYWVMFMIGVSGPRPVIDEVAQDSFAARAGLQAGDEITAIDGRATPTWEAALHAVVEQVLDGARPVLTVVAADGRARELRFDFAGVAIDDISQGDVFATLGLTPRRGFLPPVISQIEPGGAAERAGLAVGDRVLEADGVAIGDWTDWVNHVRAHPGEPIQARVRGPAGERSLVIVPDRVTEGDELIGRIGAGVDVSTVENLPPMGMQRHGPIAAFGHALEKTGSMTIMTLQIIGKMIVGEASVENLSGPISIAQYAGQSASLGLTAFIAFLAVVSVSLGVLNLLPIPLLDGGHLLFYLIEFVTRRPVSETVQGLGQQVGLILLLGLMSIAIFNDIMRII